MISIIQGSKASFIVRLRDSNDDPVNLTGLTAAETCFLKSDGTELTLGLSTGIAVSGNPLLGKLLISLTAAQTSLLDTQDPGVLELSFTISGDPIKVRIMNAYEILESVC